MSAALIVLVAVVCGTALVAGTVWVSGWPTALSVVSAVLVFVAPWGAEPDRKDF